MCGYEKEVLYMYLFLRANIFTHFWDLKTTTGISKRVFSGIFEFSRILYFRIPKINEFFGVGFKN